MDTPSIQTPEHFVDFVLLKTFELTSLPWHYREDLRQAGRVGVWKAEQDFKPEMGLALTTYAHARVRGEMLDWARTASNWPRNVRIAMRSIEDTSCSFDSRTYAESVHGDDIEEQILLEETIDKINAYGDTLKGKHAVVWKKWYKGSKGQAGFRKHERENGQEVIAKKLGITISRVSQISREIEKKIRKIIEEAMED